MSCSTPIPATLAAAYDAARGICRRHARSFYFASRFLPHPKREHAYAVYGFCRLLDDAADERPSLASVDHFVTLLDEIYDRGIAPASADHVLTVGGAEESLAIAAFANTVQTCEIPKRHFLELAEGCRMDFTVRRYDTWAQLERYCYHVAGVVGLIMCGIFDLKQSTACENAIALGNAMQLTNILRDVREDLDRGRVYLPREDLDRFGITDDELETRRLSPAMSELVKFEIARARALYADGARGLSALPNDGSRLTASVMAVVYSGILEAIETHRHDVFAGRAKLSTIQKVARLPKAMRLARCEPGDALPDVF